MTQVKIYKDKNLQIIFAVTLTAVMGISSITPAFPRIVEELHISKTEVGMLIVAFSLPAIVLTPLLGILADRIGRKRILVPSLFLFGLAGGAGALAQEFNTLVVLRVIQGIGGAALASISVTIVGDLFPGRRRAEAVGLNGSIFGIGAALYPLVGGALAMFAWNYPFFLPLAAIPVGVLVLSSLHNPEPRNSQGLRQYLSATWGYLKDIRVASVFAARVITFTILFGAYLTYFSLFLGDSFHASPFTIGIFLASSSIVGALAASQLGRMVKIISEANLIKLNLAICATGLVLIPFMPRLELLLIPLVLFGVSHGIILPCSQSYTAGLAPFAYRAAFMSLSGTMMWVGSSLGPPIFGLAYVYGGFEGVFLSAGGLALAASVIGVIGGKLIR